MALNQLRVDNFHPTIGSVYRVIEDYMQQLTNSIRTGADELPLVVSPIDSLLIRLLAAYQPARSYAVDLAADATRGASTLLCRTNPAMRQVITLCDRPQRNWRTILDRYCRDFDFPLTDCVEAENVREALAKATESQAPVLIIAVLNDAVKNQTPDAIENWLEMVPQGAVALLGVEKTGESPALASLSVRCNGPAFRLFLPRESAPALIQSRLALVGRRDNSVFQNSITRIGQIFANQFQFLDHIKRMCDTALEQSVFLEPLPRQRAGALESNSLTTAYDLRRALADCERELAEVRQSSIFRALERIKRLGRLARKPFSALRII